MTGRRSTPLPALESGGSESEKEDCAIATFDLSDLPDPPAGRSGWPWTEKDQSRPALMEDGREWPPISIVTPSYNRAQFLEKTLRSVLLQGYPRLEYIVVDRGSTDGSVQIIRKYEPWIDLWFSDPGRGQSHALNTGFERATGQIFAWISSGNSYRPGAFETVARGWPKEPAVLVGRDGTAGKEEPAGCRGALEALEFDHIFYGFSEDRHYLRQPACFFPAEAFRNVGGLDESLDHAMDLDLWLRLARHVPFRLLNAALCAPGEDPEAGGSAPGKAPCVELCLVQLHHGGMRAAEGRLGRLFEDFQALSRRVRPFVDNPLYRFMRPLIARLFWRSLSPEGGP